MTLIVALLPQFHDQIGSLDELELCLAPIIVVIVLVVHRFWSRRQEHIRQRQRTRGKGKNS